MVDVVKTLSVVQGPPGAISDEDRARIDAAISAAALLDASVSGTVIARDDAAAAAGRAESAASVATDAAQTSVEARNAAYAARDQITGMRVDTGLAGTQVSWDGATLTVPQGLAGASGWTPVMTAEADGARVVLRVIDWTGGAGAKPALGYVGPAGIVGMAAAATDIRGAAGASPMATEQLIFAAELQWNGTIDPGWNYAPMTVKYDPLGLWDATANRFFATPAPAALTAAPAGMRVLGVTIEISTMPRGNRSFQISTGGGKSAPTSYGEVLDPTHGPKTYRQPFLWNSELNSPQGLLMNNSSGAVQTFNMYAMCVGKTNLRLYRMVVPA
ncbi:hypothetical protein ACEYYA_02630 [Paracoccus sp. p3-h83]|uniref:hypothetical protein n=1 Tax=Paracoccus sp. p3-h83 TaxID=3342805 RepID=UPI0035BAC083